MKKLTKFDLVADLVADLAIVGIIIIAVFLLVRMWVGHV